MPYFASPNLPAAAFAGVRTRRMARVLPRLRSSSRLVVAVLWSVLFVATFGLAALLLPPLFPFVAFFYNGMTVSGRPHGNAGHARARYRDPHGRRSLRVSFITAAVHAVLLYVSWMVPPVFLVSLLTGDKRCLHDIVGLGDRGATPRLSLRAGPRAFASLRLRAGWLI